jgi:hypothetical protein
MKNWQALCFSRYGVDLTWVDRYLSLSVEDRRVFPMGDRRVLNQLCGLVPPPEPKVGQVWADANIETRDTVGRWYTDTSGFDDNGDPVAVSESMIVGVSRNPPNENAVDPENRSGSIGYRFYFNVGAGPGNPSNELRQWPPEGAILVSGPGAPWAPPQEVKKAS